jgi:hypothetical protein
MLDIHAWKLPYGSSPDHDSAPFAQSMAPEAAEGPIKLESFLLENFAASAFLGTP